MSTRATERRGLLGNSFRKLSMLFTSDTGDMNPKKYDDSGPENRRIVILGTGDSGKTVLAQKVMLGIQPNVQPNISPEESREKIINPVLDEATFVLQLFQQEAKTDVKALSQSVQKMRKQEGYRNFEEFAKLILQIYELPNLEQLLETKYINYRQSRARRFLKLARTLKDFAKNTLDWVPSTNEILLHVPSTTGLSSSACLSENKDLVEVYDFGGNMSERRKWKIILNRLREDTSRHATVLVFAVPLADFDAPLFEKQDLTRLQDSVNTFQQLMNDTDIAFKRVYIVFTKFDLLENALKTPETLAYLKTLGYKGNSNSDFLAWIETLFVSKAEDMLALRGDDFIKSWRVSAFDTTNCKEFADELFNDLV